MGKQGKRFISGSIPGCCRTSSEWEVPRSLVPRLQARGSRRFSGAPGKVDCYKGHFNKSWSKCHCSKNNWKNDSNLKSSTALHVARRPLSPVGPAARDCKGCFYYCCHLDYIFFCYVSLRFSGKICLYFYVWFHIFSANFSIFPFLLCALWLWSWLGTGLVNARPVTTRTIIMMAMMMVMMMMMIMILDIGQWRWFWVWSWLGTGLVTARPSRPNLWSVRQIISATNPLLRNSNCILELNYLDAQTPLQCIYMHVQLYMYMATHIEIVKLESGLHWSHNTWGRSYIGQVYQMYQVHQCTKCTGHITLGARETQAKCAILRAGSRSLEPLIKVTFGWSSMCSVHHL